MDAALPILRAKPRDAVTTASQLQPEIPMHYFDAINNSAPVVAIRYEAGRGTLQGPLWHHR